MKQRLRLFIGLVAGVPLLLAMACASSGSSPDPLPIVEAADSAGPSMRDLYETGDYAGVVGAFTADTTLVHQDTALFLAAIASALPGHSAHDPARAHLLLSQLRAGHPDSGFLTETRLLINLLEAVAELRDQNDQLAQELEQMKAIDLGQQP